MNSILIYDLEIIHAVPGKDGDDRLPGIVYCKGWEDHANMGISVIGAYDYKEDRYRVFLRDNFPEFAHLCCNRQVLAGFNNTGFDNKVLNANEFIFPMPQIEAGTYDLCVQIKNAAGVDQYTGGYSLEKVCRANFNTGKSGGGDLAPVLWQRNRRGQVIDYCLEDVRLTRLLMDLVLHGMPVLDPTNGKELWIPKP